MITIIDGIVQPNPDMPAMPKSVVLCERSTIQYEGRAVTVEVVCNRAGSKFWYRAGRYSDRYGHGFSTWDARELTYEDALDEIAQLAAISEAWEAGCVDRMIG